MEGILNKPGLGSIGAVHKGYDKDGTRRHRSTPSPVSNPLNATHSIPGSSRPPVKSGDETRTDVGIK